MLRGPRAVTGRVALATVGGYFATSSAASLLCRLVVACGGARAGAVTLGTMLAFVLYLALILWVFAARSAWPPLALFAALIGTSEGLTLLSGHAF